MEFIYLVINYRRRILYLDQEKIFALLSWYLLSFFFSLDTMDLSVEHF